MGLLDKTKDLGKKGVDVGKKAGKKGIEVGKKGVDKTKDTTMDAATILVDEELTNIWMGDGLGANIVSAIPGDIVTISKNVTLLLKRYPMLR